MGGVSPDARADPHGQRGRAPLKVLYICGSGRSGSTIVGDVLGELDGFFHAGQLRTLWGRSWVGEHLCGCGLPALECAFWSSVFDRALAGGPGPQLDPMEFDRLREQAVRFRYLPRMLRRSRRHEPLLEPLRTYADAAERLYLAIAEASGARIVVDSSKRPADAALLRSLPNVEPFFLQLVRDPRAVAYSWQRHKPSPGSRSEEMRRLSPWTSTKYWDLVNLTTEVPPYEMIQLNEHRRRHDPCIGPTLIQFQARKMIPVVSIQ